MVDLQATFPITDAPSARFMQYKALCLFRAGVITPVQKHLIDDIAADALMAAFDEAPQVPAMRTEYRHAA